MGAGHVRRSKSSPPYQRGRATRVIRSHPPTAVLGGSAQLMGSGDEDKKWGGKNGGGRQEASVHGGGKNERLGQEVVEQDRKYRSSRQEVGVGYDRKWGQGSTRTRGGVSTDRKWSTRPGNTGPPGRKCGIGRRGNKGCARGRSGVLQRGREAPPTGTGGTQTGNEGSTRAGSRATPGRT